MSSPHRFGSVSRLAECAGSRLGRAPGVHALRAQQHPSTITAGLETIQIRPNVYVIFGAGANVTVHVGEDGLVLVDSGSSEMADDASQGRQVDLAAPDPSHHQHQRGRGSCRRQRRHRRRRRAGEPRPIRPREPRDRARPRERAAAHERADGKPIAFSHEDVADRDIHLAIPADVCQ